uniref:Uncharacterized protein n=1 Tax=Mola mola TaxID=94237 RepID=A0A3Q3XM91_MOLML
TEHDLIVKEKGKCLWRPPGGDGDALTLLPSLYSLYVSTILTESNFCSSTLMLMLTSVAHASRKKLVFWLPILVSIQLATGRSSSVIQGFNAPPGRQAK